MLYNIPRDSLGRLLGWKHGCPKEVAEKISRTLIGHEVRESTREKIRKTLKEKDPTNWDYMRVPLKPEIKEKVRIGMLGKHNSPKTEFKKGILAPNWNGFKKGRIPWNWQGGISFEPNTKEWTKGLRETARWRDNHICQKCGRTQEEEKKSLGSKLVVHHIDYNKKNCHPDNLITLCRSCNAVVNFNRNYWQEFFEMKMKKQPLRISTITKSNYLATKT